MKKILCSFLLICVISCSSDDGSTPVVNETSLDALRAESIQLLTGTNEKVWRISQAILQNGQNTINISSNFNVRDDEFIFSDTNIEWRQGDAIQYDAANANEAKQDYYKAPENYGYSFLAESATQFSSNSNMTYGIQENGSVVANFEVENAIELQLTLVPKTLQDYASVENSSLQFTEAFTVNASLPIFGTGMIGANSDQSIYLAHNGYYNNSQSQRVLKIDLVNGTETEQITSSYNYVYKKLHVLNNKLSMVNTQTVEFYELDLSSSPNSYPAGGNFGQAVFGTAAQGDDIYIVGGHYTGDPKEIFRFNMATQTYTPFATLPEARYGADATIINNKLYVFGGATDFPAVQPPQNTIYIIPLDNPSNIETLEMNQNMNVTYVKAYQNLIYVAGITFTGNTVVGISNRESYIGVFNTLNNTYQELQHNLPNASGLEAIEEMCIVNNKMYVIYGDMTGQGLHDWKIYEATLN
ncbi:Kelch repeat-containing protein [Kordia zhangzhouensis]|uniref:hypothetical protein n=1 Tax=Kordia zhangzhouensis TaxID=1620405 RepID=UPI0012E06790|nr:hypothetical protein [Kordia zhangzhouensis]